MADFLITYMSFDKLDSVVSYCPIETTSEQITIEEYEYFHKRYAHAKIINMIKFSELSAFEKLNEYKRQLILNKINNIELPREITEIAKIFFANCVYLKYISLHSNIIKIGEKAFIDCINLEDIKIRQVYLQEIGDNAFENCKSLKSIYLPITLKKIGKDIFKGCDNLKEITLGHANVAKLLSYHDRLLYDKLNNNK